MVAFGHTAVGTLVGLITYQYLKDTNPAITLITAGTAGVISHYIADFIPHGHFIRHNDFKKRVWEIIIFDLGFSVVLLLAISYFNFGQSLKTFAILFGIAGSQLPDVLDGLIYIKVLKAKGILKLENNFHIAMHWHGKFEKSLV